MERPNLHDQALHKEAMTTTILVETSIAKNQHTYRRAQAQLLRVRQLLAIAFLNTGFLAVCSRMVSLLNPRLITSWLISRGHRSLPTASVKLLYLAYICL